MARLGSIDDLLSIEDDPAILGFRCPATGLLLWPLVRVAFLREILGEVFYGGATAPALSGYSLRAVQSLAKAAWHDFRHSPNGADVVVMASGAGRVMRSGQSYNRLADPFVDVLPKGTILIEDLFGWQWPVLRPGSRVLFHTPFQVAASVAGRCLVRSRHRSLADQLIAFVVDRAGKSLGWAPRPIRQASVARMLAHKMAALPVLQHGYRQLFERVRPRLLLKEEACYGPSAMLISVAREFGIITAEYQHGVVAPGHDAYNFAPTLCASPAWRAILPDWFLSYGQWWDDQINAPIKRRVIGNPYRSLLLEGSGTGSMTSRQHREVLVLGDGIETNAYVGLARALAQALPTWHVVFRPHPLERQLVSDRHPNGIPVDDGRFLEVDLQGDLYRSFKRSTVVISEMSTGLFEAMGLVQVPLLWDTPKSRFTLPTHSFASFRTVDECAEILRNHVGDDACRDDAGAIWAPDWQSRYRAFLNDVLQGNNAPLVENVV